MSTFTQAQQDAAARSPVDAVTVPVSAWSRDWKERPKGDVCMGLRTVPSRDLEDARKAAADAATKLYPRAMDGEPFFSLWADHYHDMLLRSIVARGTCDPNDVTAPWDGWQEDPDELARTNLSTEGVQHIFDAWERMRLANDVTTPPASDDDLVEMADLMSEVDKLPRPRALRVRRLSAYVLAELRTLSPET